MDLFAAKQLSSSYFPPPLFVQNRPAVNIIRCAPSIYKQIIFLKKNICNDKKISLIGYIFDSLFCVISCVWWNVIQVAHALEFGQAYHLRWAELLVDGYRLLSSSREHTWYVDDLKLRNNTVKHYILDYFSRKCIIIMMGLNPGWVMLEVALNEGRDEKSGFLKY